MSREEDEDRFFDELRDEAERAEDEFLADSIIDGTIAKVDLRALVICNVVGHQGEGRLDRVAQRWRGRCMHCGVGMMSDGSG